MQTTLGAADLRREWKRLLEREYVPPRPEFDFEWFEQYSTTQSIIFAVDMLPYIHWMLSEIPHGVTLSVLDAGCASGAGTHFIASLHRNTMLRHRFEMTGIDIVPTFKAFADAAYDSMRFVIGDVFELEPDSYDVVICSHVIEHFADPTEFMRKLQSVARYGVVFYCPFEERKLLGNGKGHKISISRPFIESFQPTFAEIRSSRGWVHPEDAESKCALFILPGSRWSDLKKSTRANWTGAHSILPLTGRDSSEETSDENGGIFSSFARLFGCRRS